MKNIQLLLSPFHPQPALFARVYLPAPWQAGLPGRTRCETTVRRPHHRKSLGVYLNLLPVLDLSLTKATLGTTAPIYKTHSPNVRAAPRFSPTRFIPLAATLALSPRLDCF
jgi:hypothetical protein